MQEKYSRRIGSYKLTDRVLGQGSFSRVLLGYACRNKIAVKVIPRQEISSSDLSSFESQVEILRSLNNDHIVQLIDFKKTPNNFYLFLEYCEGGNLADYIKLHQKLPQKQALKLFKQIMLGVSAMHQFKIIHRDLKPANILLKNGHIKIADFGLARKFSKNEMLRTYAGTPFNMAPQVLRRQLYNHKVDVYSAGTVLYEMLYGCSPFRGRDQIALLESIQKRSYSGQNKEVSQRTQNLLKEMLAVNVQERIEVIDILSIINDYECQMKQKLLEEYRKKSISKIGLMGAPGGLGCAFQLTANRYESRQMDQRLYHRLSRQLSNQIVSP